ncbi:terminase large subunit domain-containing protein [Vibrio paucivorans]
MAKKSAPQYSEREIDLQAECDAAGVDLERIELGTASILKEAFFLPYQSAWFNEEAPLALHEKSRRTGITFAQAGKDALTASKPRVRGGRNTFYIGTKKEMALEYIAAVALFAKAYNAGAKANVYEVPFWDDDNEREILAYMIRFPNSGFKVQALSSNPANIRGLQGDVTIDEAAHQPELDEMLKAVQAVLMWGGRVRMISTHNGADSLFNKTIIDALAGRNDWVIHRTPLKEACRQGLYRRICAVTHQEWSIEAEEAWIEQLYRNAPSKEDAEEEYGCIPKLGGGTYIPRTLLELAKRKVRVVRFNGSSAFNKAKEPHRRKEMKQWLEEHVEPLLERLPPRPHAFGEDFARSGHLSVFCPMTINQDSTRHVPFLVEMHNVPHKQQEQAIKFICDRLPKLCKLKLDGGGNGHYVAEAAQDEYGSLADIIMLGESFYREQMPKFKAAFEDQQLTIPADEDVITDLTAIKVINGVPKVDRERKVKGDKKKRHGDAAIAIWFAYLASLDNMKSVYGSHSIKKKAGQKPRRNVKCTLGLRNRGGLL